MTELDDDVASMRPEPTGVGSVDAVIAAVDELGDQPLEAHVRTFEQAHDELRRALDERDELDEFDPH